MAASKKGYTECCKCARELIRPKEKAIGVCPYCAAQHLASIAAFRQGMYR